MVLNWDFVILLPFYKHEKDLYLLIIVMLVFVAFFGVNVLSKLFFSYLNETSHIPEIMKLSLPSVFIYSFQFFLFSSQRLCRNRFYIKNFFFLCQI